MRVIALQSVVGGMGLSEIGMEFALAGQSTPVALVRRYTISRPAVGLPELESPRSSQTPQSLLPIPTMKRFGVAD